MGSQQCLSMAQQAQIIYYIVVTLHLSSWQLFPLLGHNKNTEIFLALLSEESASDYWKGDFLLKLVIFVHFSSVLVKIYCANN